MHTWKKMLFCAGAIAFATMTLTTSCQQKATDPESRYRELIDQVKKEYAPDRRDKTFDISIKEQDGQWFLSGSTTEEAAREALVERLHSIDAKATADIRLLPDTAQLGTQTWGVATLSSTSLRYGANYSAEMATQVPMGTPLRVLEKRSYWYRVVTPEGYIAWTTTTGVARMDEAAFENWKKSDKIMVTADFVQVLERPNSQAATVSDAILGNILATNNRTHGQYLAVSLPDGRNGWIPRSATQAYDQWLQSRRPTQENILATAQHFNGYPYLWGGTTTKAMDCSGFTKTVYFLNGIILRRDASQQAKTGTEVEVTENFENLQPGDLLFFGRKATAERKESITHVGIYMGNQRFIHSASRVKINSLNPDAEDYYDGSNNLVRVRRILGNQDQNLGITSLQQHPWY